MDSAQCREGSLRLTVQPKYIQSYLWTLRDLNKACLRLSLSKLMKISISSLKVSDEDEILPPKLQAALIQILEERNEILAQEQNFLQGMRQVV